jgi:hypothetical protein
MAKKKTDDNSKVIAESEARPPQAGKMVLWTILSGERRELGRAAARQHG